MKKILFAATFLMFVGAMGTTAYAASETSNDTKTEITKKDDKKKKRKKKSKKADAKKKCEEKSCCSSKKAA